MPNITRAIESNLRAKPPLMVQKKKMGTTRQARKQYAITPEGVDFVENKLGSAAGAEEGLTRPRAQRSREPAAVSGSAFSS